MRYRWLVFALLVGALAFAAAGCGGDDDGGGGAEGSEDVSGSITLMGIWVGTEQQAIENVLDGFREAYPNVEVEILTFELREFEAKLAVSVPAGSGPDILALHALGR